MCSLVHPCAENDAPAGERRIPHPPGGKVRCKKCVEAPAAVNLRLRDAYCAACFLASSTHKFRAGLGKRKVVRPGERVLVAFGGGAGALAALRLLAEGEREERSGGARRKMLFEAYVVVVDETGPFFDDPTQRFAFVNELIRKAGDFPFPVYCTSLEHALESHFRPEFVKSCGDGGQYCLPSKTSTGQLRRLLDGTSELSAKEALQRHLRRRVLLQIAEVLGATKIFTGESSETLAISLMSGMAAGRGAHLSADTGYLDDRHHKASSSSAEKDSKGITIVRVMRDFSRKEVAMYNALMKLPPPSVPPTFSQGRDVLSSIKRLTEDFVVRLQEDFTATVPTILRTGAKLEPSPSAATGAPCALCGGEDGDGEASSGARNAAEFSRAVSLRGAEGFSKDEAVLLQDLRIGKGEERLCYSCGVNCSKMSVLPPFLAAEAEGKKD